MGAPLPPVPNAIRCLIGGFTDNTKLEKWANVLHFTYSGGPPSVGDLTTIANGIGGQWGISMASVCPSPTSLQQVELTDLGSLTGAEVVTTQQIVGTRGDDSIPANAAVLVSYPSALRYKGGHPRTYLYVLGNADLTGSGSWTNPATLEVQHQWQDFLSHVVGRQSGTTVLTAFCSIRYHGKYLPNGGPPHYYLTNPLVNTINLTQLFAHTQIASQKGRIGRRAE